MISARNYIRDHGLDAKARIAPNVVMFHTGSAIPYLSETRHLREYSFKIPGFLGNPPVYGLEGSKDVCLVQGGYGAPAAACLVEAVVELGCRRIFALGLGGGVAEDVELGDAVIPSDIVREEGTSFHYVAGAENACPDAALLGDLRRFLTGKDDLRVHEGKTVSTDAPFRQTVDKERRWRDEGILAVEMELSAVLTVARYHRIPAVALLVISDKHDLEGVTPWTWGKDGMREGRERAIDLLVDFARGISKKQG